MSSYSVVDFQEVIDSVRSEFRIHVVEFSDLLKMAELRDGWVSLDHWQSLDDHEILDHLVESEAQPEEFYIVTDVSYLPGRGCFRVGAGKLHAFADDYQSMCGESLFNGDVIMLSPQCSSIWFFHHEGMLLHWIVSRADKDKS